jgi:hypothetical protein
VAIVAIRGFLSISLDGDWTLQARLRELTPRLEKAALRTALRESARPMLAAAQKFAPVYGTKTFVETVFVDKRWRKRTFATGRIGGSLRKSLRIRAFKRSRKNRVGVWIGTSALASPFQGKQFYGAFQEFGWKVGVRPERDKRVAGAIAQRLNFFAAARQGSTGQRGGAAHEAFVRSAQKAAATQSLSRADTRRFIEGKKYIRKAYNLTKYRVRNEMRTQIVRAIDVVVNRDLARIRRKAGKAA